MGATIGDDVFYSGNNNLPLFALLALIACEGGGGGGSTHAALNQSSGAGINIKSEQVEASSAEPFPISSMQTIVGDSGDRTGWDVDTGIFTSNGTQHFIIGTPRGGDASQGEVQVISTAQTPVLTITGSYL